MAGDAKALADIAGTSGIQTQSYSTFGVTTMRKAITKLEVSGYAPASIVLHPTDFRGRRAGPVVHRDRALEPGQSTI